MGSEKRVGGSPVLRTYHSYDNDNRLSSQGWQLGSDTFAQTYAYDEWDGSLSAMTFSQSGETLFSMTYGYDSLRRLSTASNGLLTRTYSYTPNGSQTTAQVSSLAYTGPASSFTYGYTYDNMGNIHTYTDSNGTVTYTYDDLGQLTQAVHGDTTYAYTYDNAGNILSGNGHTYTYGDTDGWTDLLTAVDGQAITYDAIGNPTSYYNGTRWAFTWTQGRQLMTAFTTSTTRDVGITYSYDADGLRTGKIVTAETYSTHTHSYTASQVVEPTCTQRGYTLYTCTCGLTAKNDYVAALGHDYTNDLGAVMATCQRCGYRNTGATLPVQPIVPPGSGTISGGETVEPSDSAGEVMTASTADARTLLSTTVKEYEYIYAGTTLVRMVVTTTVDDGTPTVQTLDFGYDASGMPVTVTTGGATYYYITNLQGDVMALVDSTGATVAQYSYDPYGGVIDATGDLAEINPLTYRGYVYDTETSLYYLQSRYYDPELGRFINADSYASTGQGIIGNNMFAYCGNNPIVRKDSAGTAYAFLADFTADVDPDGQFDEGGSGGGGWGLGVKPSYYTAQRVQSYDSSWQNSRYNQNPTSISGTSACFIAGTLIQCEDGTKPIEEIEAGDLVWAYDEETGDMALKEVAETYVNETSELVHISVNGEEIVATPTHPFYSPIKGWTDAVHLRAGDILVLVNGEYVVVEKVQYEILESPVTVYNFQVADYHTYYVSSEGILVHNTCSTPNSTTPWDIHSNSQGQVPVGKTAAYHDGHGYYWMKDTAGHGESYYKVFILKGKYLIWQYDADAYGNFIYGKHKSDNGTRIRVG